MSLTQKRLEGPRKRAQYDKIDAAYRELQKIKPDEAQAFRDMIGSPVLWTSPDIAAALRNLGYDVDDAQVRRYRQKLRAGKVVL